MCIDVILSLLLVRLSFDVLHTGIEFRKKLFAVRFKTSVDELMRVAKAGQKKSAQMTIMSLTGISVIGIVALAKLDDFFSLPTYLCILLFTSAASDWYWWRRFIRNDLTAL